MDQYRHNLMRRKIALYSLVLALTPAVPVAVLVALAERLLGGDGRVALWVVGPFLRAVDRVSVGRTEEDSE